MTFKLNPFQEKVLSSESRITILTTQPGAGLTTALLLKGIQDSLESKKAFVIFVTHNGDKSAEFYAKNISVAHPDVKVSAKSKIITVRVGKKKVKIKCMSDASLILSKYVPVVCIDSSRTGDLQTLSLLAGKLNIGGNGNYFKDNSQLSWLKNLEDSQKWLINVVKGSTVDNLCNLTPSYWGSLQMLSKKEPMFNNSFTLKDW